MANMDTGEARRPRLLLASYACTPGCGSEGGGGWHRAVEAARRFDTWVICDERDCAAAIHRYLEREGAVPGLHFCFVAQRRWEARLWRVPGLGYLAYNLWQRRALAAGRRLHRQHHFDLVHQMAFGTYREPGYWWKLGVPLVWGPFGGTQNYPWRYLGLAGFRGACVEAARTVWNHLQLCFSRRVRTAARRAAALLAANSTTQRDFARVVGRLPQLMPDTGIAPPAARGTPPPPAPVLPDARAKQIATTTTVRPLRILWAGRLIPCKALGLLIEALAVFAGEAACEVRVVGDGPEKRRWQRLARRRGVEHALTWPGRIPHDAMREHYAWADVFVFTSLRDNLGTVLPEAMGAGLPIVCIDHQGAHDVVTGECGIKLPLTRPRDTIARLADALRRLAGDAGLRERLGRAAYERARDYTWPQLGARMAEVYRDVLDGQAHSQPLGERGAPVAQACCGASGGTARCR
jgi:glycosyltransferase involved in cell wall biosynthesis